MQQATRRSSKLLLVEDDEPLAGEIVTAFAAEALAVERVFDPELLLVRAAKASAILLNRASGDRDSIHIIERMRAAGDETPVIVISDLASVEERINGLRSGADDYLSKPFVMGELVARVMAARRRYNSQQRSALTVGQLVLDRVERTVRREGRPIDLLPREFQLLDYLMQNAGSVVTRDMLLRNVWNMRGATTPTNVIDVQIGKLRRKINDDGTLIVNVRGIGFRLEAPDAFWRDQSIVSLSPSYA